METLVFGFSEVSAFQKCIWLQLSTKFERKYIATLTKCCKSKCVIIPSTALTSDDLDTPRAPVQMLLFVAVLLALIYILNAESGPTQFYDFRNYFYVTCSLTRSQLISSLIKAACSNLNEESRVLRD